MRTSKIAIMAMISMLVWTGTAIAQNLVVVVNKDNPVTGVTSDMLKRYYESAGLLWDSGSKVDPADYSDNHPLAVRFCNLILGKSIEKKHMIWVRKVFRGEGTPPTTFSDESSVIEYVASNRGAVGYVTEETVNDRVKVITVDGKARF